MEHNENTLNVKNGTEGMEFIQRLLFETDKKKTESKKNLPRVLAAKRLKYYHAIGKHHLINVNDTEVNIDDENLSLECLFYEPLSKDSFKPTVFDDSIVIENFKKMKRPQFNLKEYIEAAKCLYHNWVGTKTGILGSRFRDTLIYLLANSRDFNEPSKNLYCFSEEGTEEIVLDIKSEKYNDNLPGDTVYTRKLNQLIADLQCEYSETKYRQLNLNVTYLTLLLARRIVKSKQEFRKALLSEKTNKDFVTLCPNPLDSKLPESSEIEDLNFGMTKPISLVSLIAYGYLNSKGKTRQIFRITCINYMEYNGIGLAKLFYDVAKVYGIDDYKLWDIMSNYEDCCQAMFALADLAHTHSEMNTSVPPKTYKLFPFCRLLNQGHHSDLANKYYKNFIACYALAILVDLKLGETQSFARKAHWTKSFSTIWTAKGERIALDIHKIINTDSS